jgi:hypothetical protein
MGVARFGPGIAIVTRTDISPSTPINIGYAQSLALSWKGSTKDLFGQDQFPILSARSTIKTSGKLVAATDSGIAMNTMFFGQTFTTGGIIWNIGETPTITSHSATVANSATFDVDLGVTYVATSLPLTKVASPTAAGQYSEAAGVYTFFTSDSGATTGNIAITYSSTVTTPGQNIIIANKLIGFTPTFQLDYYTNVNQPAAKPVIYRIYSCISDSLADDFKLEDFALPTFDFSFFQNAAGNIAGKYYNEVS